MFLQIAGFEPDAAESAKLAQGAVVCAPDTRGLNAMLSQWVTWHYPLR
jgi:hypothetical protein